MPPPSVLLAGLREPEEEPIRFQPEGRHSPALRVAGSLRPCSTLRLTWKCSAAAAPAIELSTVDTRERMRSHSSSRLRCSNAPRRAVAEHFAWLELVATAPGHSVPQSRSARTGLMQLQFRLLWTAPWCPPSGPALGEAPRSVWFCSVTGPLAGHAAPGQAYYS